MTLYTPISLTVLRDHVFRLGVAQFGLTVVLSRFYSVLLSVCLLRPCFLPLEMRLHPLNHDGRGVPLQIAVNRFHIFLVDAPQFVVRVRLSPFRIINQHFLLFLLT
jgi:hypothetical protein